MKIRSHSVQLWAMHRGPRWAREYMTPHKRGVWTSKRLVDAAINERGGLLQAFPRNAHHAGNTIALLHLMRRNRPDLSWRAILTVGPLTNCPADPRRALRVAGWLRRLQPPEEQNP